MNYNTDECLVAIFAVDETTTQLSKYCFEQIGFKNTILIEGPDGFTDKFLKFATLAAESDYKFYIRSDSDRLTFSGMLELLEAHTEKDDVEVSEGLGFDYFMNNYRGATPHIFTREPLKRLHENNDLIKNVHKPENYFVKKNGLTFLSKKILTNLHDYGQKPSKACNAFLNRLLRDSPPLRLYDPSYLRTLPDFYVRALEHALDIYQTVDKTNMDYIDFSFLDEGYFDEIENNLENHFLKYQEIYNSLKESV